MVTSKITFYVFNPGNFGFNRNRNIMGATYLDLLKQRNDPRIYIVADPAPAFFDPADPLNLDAYRGAATGAEQGPLQVLSDNGELFLCPMKSAIMTIIQGNHIS